MALIPYVLELDRTIGGRVLPGGADTVVVAAENVADARAMAANATGTNPAAWNSTEASGTAIVEDATEFESFTLRVAILDSDPVIDIKQVGTSTNDTIDEIAAAIVTHLNATDIISGASYDNATNILTIAAIADALGDKQVLVEVYPTIGIKLPIPGFVGTITDGGLAAAALTVQLAVDGWTFPKVYGLYKKI